MSQISQPMPMSTYPIEKLLQLWRSEELTVEQAIGHLLQHQAALEAANHALQQQMQRVVRSQLQV
jgi:hypothetical protein